MAKKLVRVMTPKPPICISMIMMNNPSDVNVEETSTETNPVTQMALVAVNRASIKECHDKWHAEASVTLPLSE